MVSSAARGDASIAGGWVLQSPSAVVEAFYEPDGNYTCVIRSVERLKFTHGRFVLDGESLTVTLDDGKTISRRMRIDGDSLTLLDEHGNAATMRRLTGKSPYAIVGTWIWHGEEGMRIEATYAPDGSYACEVVAPKADRSVRGRYASSEDAVTVNTGAGGNETCRWRLIDANTLELSIADGRSTRYMRKNSTPMPAQTVVRPPVTPENIPSGRVGRPGELPSVHRDVLRAEPSGYLREFAPKLTTPDRKASGHILYTHAEPFRLGEGDGAVTVKYGRIWIMDGDGGNKRPFIAPKGPTAVNNASWSSDGTRVLFDSNFETARSALYQDVFLADLPAGIVRRLTGVEAWAPPKGFGILMLIISDTTGTGTTEMVSFKQFNFAVQTMDGKIFTPVGQLPKRENEVHPRYYVTIPNVPSGTIWVKCWHNRFIGDVRTVVLPTGGREVVDMDACNGTYAATNPCITPDGRYVVYTAQHAYFSPQPAHRPQEHVPHVSHDGIDTMAVMDTQTGTPVALWNPTQRHETAVDAKLSPDGKFIAFTWGTVSKNGIGVCSLESFVQGRPDARMVVPPISGLQLNIAGGLGNCQPSWSPDGRQLAFVRYIMTTENHNGNVFVVNSDGSNLRQLTELAPNQRPAWPTWSRDGSRIAFQVLTSQRDKLWITDEMSGGVRMDIYTIAADGSDVRQLTDDGCNGEPSWGP
jgi:Tol biopolymer transport system component